MYYKIYKTSIGKIQIISNDKEITHISFNNKAIIKDAINKETEIIKQTIQQINEYLNGARKSFNIKINPKGTEFQKSVWNELTKIPYGETRTYKDIAIKIKNPKAYRAVGNANNKNPIGIIIPCHRVIGSKGELTGYAGGLKIKQKLLQIEKQRYDK